jgi:hypothetical protein
MKKLVGTKIGNVVNLMIHGNAYQKTFATQDEANDFFKLMIKARSGDESAYAEIMVELNRRYKTLIKGILEKDNDDNFYLKGLDIKMPKLLGETFLDYLENNFPVTALVNFWKLLVTNPDPRVREDLFTFLREYNFAITDNGYFNAYKAVEVKQQADNDLAAFVSNQYLKIKKWKKNPADYEVVTFSTVESEFVDNPAYEYYGDIDEDDVDNENYDRRFDEDNGEPEQIETFKTTYVQKLVKAGQRNPDNGAVETVHGNLADLFKNIDKLVENRSVYQSRHSDKNGNKVEQVLGEPVKMARIDTDNDPRLDCSQGLHVGSVKYVESFSSKTDTILLVLVNPAHVVAVPEHDNSKMRTCEYFPYSVLDRLEKTDGQEISFEVIEEIPYFEEDYMKYEKADLEKEITRIQNEIAGTFKPTKEQLDYKKILEDRIVVLDGVLDAHFQK